MIKAIIFDCFGVLTGDIWKEFLSSLSEDQKIKAVKLNHALDSGNLSHEDFYHEIHQLTGRTPQEVENIIDSPMQKNRQLLDYIAELKQDYKLGILSNISSKWITEEFLSESEVALFDDIVLSCEIGYTKPNKEAFEVCVNRMNVKARETIMVDDSSVNCQGAIRAGLRVVLYKDFEAFKKDLKLMLH